MCKLILKFIWKLKSEAKSILGGKKGTKLEELHHAILRITYIRLQ